jgi:CHAT domain-containing protein/predicted negative regulator of RcsB-dependent stress response
VNLSDPGEYLSGLVQIRDAAQQRAYIADAKAAPTAELVEALSLKIRDTAWKDPALAEALTESNLYLASLIDTPSVWAYATRSRAQVLHTMRKCAEAQPHFERAVQLFSQAGLAVEAGRTMVTEMENLAYLSRYEEAIRLEGPARAALEKVQDTRYLTLIEASLGNLYYRLKRFSESLAHYEKAGASSDNPASTAAIGMGRAHVLTEMNRFDEALEAFKTTRQHCEQHGLSLWVDIADRGISRMHLQSGNYSMALQMLDQIRRKHEAANDSRRVGLCDIDRTEVYLQLNLFQDASSVAARAYELFQKLGNRYESALSLTFRGIAEFKLMNDSDADTAFTRARELFVEEGNETWIAAADLWRAQLLIRKQQFAEAGQLARHSAEVFERQQVPVRAANARVLSAQTLQEMQETRSAIADAQRALQELEGFHAPWVSYQAFNTLGKLKEIEGATAEAEELYLRAITELELLRGNIRLDELRMSFGKDKYQVYENIINVKLNRGDMHSAFDFVERSKSRTLIDLMERNLETAWDTGGEDSPRLLRIRKIREELNILYSRLSDVGTTVRGAGDTETKEQIGRREQELVELLREVGSEKPGWATLQSMPSPTVADVQNMLEPDEVLVEYYSVGERFKAFIVSRTEFHVIRDLSSTSDARVSLKGLNYQLSKFHLQAAYLKKHATSLLAASRHHLKNLHTQLIAPIEHLLKGKTKLVVVPHQMLHYVPFHALFDGENYLIDNFDVSYAASASVLRICRSRKPVAQSGRDLILAVADELTPYINDEVAALRELLPNADVFTGIDAGEDKLRKYAPTAGKIHIASHGVFRADNPMFSSLRLGDNWLNLFDIFNLKLGAEITTLSACETGMSAVWEGDELLGLARGFLYAGTPSLVVSLWMVNDRSTAQMMRRFYEGLRDNLSKARALREAILEVKAAFPHPYYWAPFILLGKS